MRLQQSLAVARKRVVTRCEKSSQNLGCSKTSTPYTSEALRKKDCYLYDKFDN